MIGFFSSSKIKLPADARKRIEALAAEFKRWQGIESMLTGQLDVSTELSRRTASFMADPTPETMEAVLSIAAISARSAQVGQLLRLVRAKLQGISDEAARLAIEPVEQAVKDAAAAVGEREKELRGEDPLWRQKTFQAPKDLERLREIKRMLEGLLSDLRNGVGRPVDPALLLK